MNIFYVVYNIPRALHCLHASEVKLLGQVIQLAVAVKGLTAGVLTSFPALCLSKLFHIPPGSGQGSMQRL